MGGQAYEDFSIGIGFQQATTHIREKRSAVHDQITLAICELDPKLSCIARRTQESPLAPYLTEEVIAIFFRNLSERSDTVRAHAIFNNVDVSKIRVLVAKLSY